MLFALALVTYETEIAFTPVLVALVIRRRRAWRPGLAMVIPAVIELAIVAALRAELTKPPSWTYTANLELGPFFRTFVLQLISVFPSSQWLLGSPTAPPLSVGSFVLAILVVGVPSALIVLAPRPDALPTRLNLFALAGVGAWVWISSTALVAVSERWQARLYRGEGYISVVYGYIGLAMILAAVFFAVERWIAPRSRRWTMAWHIVTLVLIVAISASTFAENVAVAVIPV